MDQPTSVYLYFDADGILIYVGITSRGPDRQAEHARDKPWWPLVRRQEVEHYDTRRDAESREKALIGERRPPYNVLHNSEHRETRALYEAHRAAPTPEIDPKRRAQMPLVLISRIGSRAKFATLPHWAAVAMTLGEPDRWRGARAVADTTRCGQVTGVQVRGPIAVISVDLRQGIEVVDPVLTTKVALLKGGPIHSIRSLRVALEITEPPASLEGDRGLSSRQLRRS